MTRFRRLASVTALTTLALVAVGALVRATNSGLGCLDSWPACRGGWVAPTDYHGVIEYGHRALAGVVVILCITLAVGAFRWTSSRALRVGSLTAVGVVVAQALIGGIVVTTELHAAVVTAHLVLALALVAATIGVAAGAFVVDRPPASDRKVSGMTIGALAGTFLVLVVGAYVREKGAGLVFTDWPLMGGTVLPSLAGVRSASQFAHRLLALLVFGHVVALAVRGRRDPRGNVRSLATWAAALFAAQIGAGAANVFTRLAPAAVIGHVVGGALVWAALVALAVVSRRDPAPDGPPPGGVGDAVRAYVRLTKPRIVVLLLVTTVPAMVVAAGRMPPLWLVAVTLTGGILTAGSANAFNQYLERDIDSKMSRTRSRPLPAHDVTPGRALVFAIVLGVVGTTLLAVVVNPLSASLAAGAIAFYVLVYTMLLKRSTPQNIVIGGAAGAAPVLVGWAAVTGGLGLPAWIMFAIIFFWTPPHFWALAMRYRDDYAAAGVPMLPVVRGVEETTAQILAYSAVLVAVSFALVPAASMGPVYGLAAVALGGPFVWLAVRLRRQPTVEQAMRLFKYSISYLALLFAAIAVDPLVV